MTAISIRRLGAAIKLVVPIEFGENLRTAAARARHELETLA